MTARRLAALLLLIGLCTLATGCGGSDLSGAPPAPAAEPPATEPPPAASGGTACPPACSSTDESAWTAMLAELDLEPNQHIVQIDGRRDGCDLALTITVPQDAPGEYTFADGLYGAQAFSQSSTARWKRVDTADIRTEIAPLLSPGQSAELRLPVCEAAEGLTHCCGYRVLVPVEGFAAWADIS
jgi:hypothetical protein